MFCSYWCILVVVRLVELSVMCWLLVCCSVWLNWLVIVSSCVCVRFSLWVSCFSLVLLCFCVLLMIVVRVLLVLVMRFSVCLKCWCVWCRWNLLLLVMVLVNWLCRCVSCVWRWCSCWVLRMFSVWVLVMLVSSVVRLLFLVCVWVSGVSRLVICCVSGVMLYCWLFVF